MRGRHNWLPSRETLKRLGKVISIAWVLFALAISIDAGNYSFFGSRRFDLIEFVVMFLFIGVIPLVVGWGVFWAKRSRD